MIYHIKYNLNYKFESMNHVLEKIDHTLLDLKDEELNIKYIINYIKSCYFKKNITFKVLEIDICKINRAL